MFCKHCGNEISDSSISCPNCGAEVKKAPAKAGFSVDKLKFRAGESNIIAMVAGVLLIVMVFLPFISVEFLGMSESESMIGAGGTDWIYFIIIGIGGIMAGLQGDKNQMIGMAIAACALSVWEIIDVSNAIKEVADYGMEDMVKKGIGFWLMIVASLGMLAAPFIQKFMKK